MSKVILFGCGRGAEVAYRYLRADSEHEVCGFTVDDQYCKSTEYLDLPLVPFQNVETVFSPNEYKMLVLMGFQEMNHLRAQKYFEAKSKGYSFISFVHSSINSIEPLNIGENCFILENQSINLDVKIGNNVVMWSGNHIGDSSIIEDHVWISSLVSVAGNVHIGSYSFLGINVALSNNIKIAEETYIGASALLTGDTIPYGVYINSPAKKTYDSSLRFMDIIEATKRL